MDHVDDGNPTLAAAICRALGATLKQPESVMSCQPEIKLEPATDVASPHAAWCFCLQCISATQQIY